MSMYLSSCTLAVATASLWFSESCVLHSVQHNARGILSMANSGPNTNGSQFFISYAKQPHLNGSYTIFGKVIHGFEVLDLMEKVCFDWCSPLCDFGMQSIYHFLAAMHIGESWILFSITYKTDKILTLQHKILQTPTGPGDKPLAEIRINRVTIHANPLAGWCPFEAC